MGFRRAARIDSNQTQIVSHLRQLGAKVLHLHQLKNCCDILVGYRGKLALFELKVDSKKKLTDGESKFKAEWYGYPVYTATNIDDIIDKF
jgi:hypothetical protein